MGLTKPRASQIFDLDYKQATRVITVSNVTLTGGAPAVVDGVTLTAGDRVLVTGQSTGSENGLYAVSSVGVGSDGTWVRTNDGNDDGEIKAGMIVMVTEGTTYADTQWKLTTNDPIDIGVTSLNFVINILSDVGGANTQVQINDAGTLGGSSSFTFNKTTNVLSVADINITGNIVPSANITYDLGTASNRWRDLYLSGTTIDLGGALIKTDGTSGSISLVPKPTDNFPNPKAIVISTRGGINAVDTTGGTISESDLTAAASSTNSVPTTITDLGITDGVAGQVLTTDGAGGFTFADAGGAGASLTGVTEASGNFSTSLGVNATVGLYSTSVGYDAKAAARENVAIGYGSGNASSASYYGYNVGIGKGALYHGDHGVSIGHSAGTQTYGVAVGNASFASTYGVALGSGASTNTAGIAIGYLTAPTGYYSIVLNASGAALNPSTASAFFVNPIRNVAENTAYTLYYDTTTKEVTYAAAASGYSDSDVATYLSANGYDTAANITASIPSALTDIGITDGVAGQVLTTDGAGGFTFADAGASGYGDNDVATYLSSNGFDTAANITASIPSALTDLGITDGTNGQVLTTDGAGNFTFTTVSGGGGGGGVANAEISGSTTANELSTGTYTITNYDANVAYIITISGGSYTRNGATISWTFPSVTTDTVHYLTALTVSNGVTSTLQTFNVTVQDITVADTAIIVGDFSATTLQGWY